jgi:hypothetical protein
MLDQRDDPRRHKARRADHLAGAGDLGHFDDAANRGRLHTSAALVAVISSTREPSPASTTISTQSP